MLYLKSYEGFNDDIPKDYKFITKHLKNKVNYTTPDYKKVCDLVIKKPSRLERVF